MPFYTTSEQFYGSMQMLFERICQKTPNPVDALAVTGMIIRFRVTDPQAEFTANGQYKPVRVFYGPSDGVTPDLDVEMGADILHGILTHEISLKKTFTNGQMKVMGAIWQIAPLVSILQEGRVLYPEVLRDQGLA